MKKSIKRAWAIVLCAVMLLLLAPASFAAQTLQADLEVTYGQTEARAMLARINEYRQSGEAWYWNETDTKKVKTGVLPALTYDYDLEQTAMLRAAELALEFDHTRPDGTLCFTAFSSEHALWAGGENIAYGYRTEEAVYIAWREDEDPYAGQGHRRNMLSTDYTAVGIGHAVVNGRHYWVQEFRHPNSKVPAAQALDAEKTVRLTFLEKYLDKNSLTAQDLTLVNGEAAAPVIGVSVSGKQMTPVGAKITVKDTTVAKVTDGSITALKEGATTYTVSYGGMTATAAVTVTSGAEDPDDYVFDSFVWAPDGRTAQAKLVSASDPERMVFEDAQMTAEEHAPTCTEDAYTVYTASYGEYTEENVVTAEGTATDHDYRFDSFVWAAGGRTARAKLVCSHDPSHVVYREAEITSEYFEATPEEEAYTLYTAAFDGHTEENRVPEGSGTDVMPGDVDGDGFVTASDARLALRRAVDLEDYAPDSVEYRACDIDKDGAVTASDARIILRVAVGLENAEDYR